MEEDQFKEDTKSVENLCFVESHELREISIAYLEVNEIQENTIIWLKTIEEPVYH